MEIIFLSLEEAQHVAFGVNVTIFQENALSK